MSAVLAAEPAPGIVDEVERCGSSVWLQGLPCLPLITGEDGGSGAPDHVAGVAVDAQNLRTMAETGDDVPVDQAERIDVGVLVAKRAGIDAVFDCHVVPRTPVEEHRAVRFLDLDDSVQHRLVGSERVAVTTREVREGGLEEPQVVSVAAVGHQDVVALGSDLLVVGVRAVVGSLDMDVVIEGVEVPVEHHHFRAILRKTRTSLFEGVANARSVLVGVRPKVRPDVFPYRVAQSGHAVVVYHHEPGSRGTKPGTKHQQVLQRSGRLHGRQFGKQFTVETVDEVRGAATGRSGQPDLDVALQGQPGEADRRILRLLHPIDRHSCVTALGGEREHHGIGTACGVVQRVGVEGRIEQPVVNGHGGQSSHGQRAQPMHDYDVRHDRLNGLVGTVTVGIGGRDA